MIIKEIQLTNFGKFNHKNVSLEPGLNIIYGENEAGKTTLHTFIRGMLFGIEKQRGKASGRDVYSKYEPWENPSNYQGIMRIENDGTNYRIERNFNREHRLFRVINEDEGIELTEEQIEELFAGLDESCYYNTISISQLGSVTDKELEVILKNYAANLGATKSMEIDIKEAFSDLDIQKKKIITENKIGEEDIIKKSVKLTTEQLEITEREQHKIISSIEQKKENVNHLLEKKKELSALDKKRLEELAKQNERKDKLYQDAISYTNEVEKYSNQLEQIKNHKKELESSLLEKGIDSHETMEALMDKIMNKSNMPVTFVILALAFVGAAIGFVVGNLQFITIKEYYMRPAICMGIAFILFVLAIIRYCFKKKHKKRKFEILKELRLTSDKLEAAKHEEIYVRRQLETKQEALNQTQEIIKQEENTQVSSDDYSDEIREIEAQERTLNDGVSKAQFALEQKKENEIELEKRIEELKRRLENIKKAKEEIHAIEEAKRNIEEIANEIRSSFGKRLNKQASYYMSKITNGKYDNITIDERLNITINNKKSLIPSSRLSKGTIEQMYMALRLAAADIIFEKDKKPILLDDAFVMYDNKRMGNTLKFMAESMEQVILFSCHTREKVMADKLNLEYNFIKL
ncbi:ATP-binding protein [uncultured Eubacterium sp.]|uniref:ATP-binding protein n=1 Tax=uncultured Eubacterium sp. TaxID=165185 RepID=UPI002671AEB1|nr:AAA family ATPase [uncultured Eubacterium sp.]